MREQSNPDGHAGPTSVVGPEELQLATGKTAYAIIKASSVMVGVD
jgi:molybdopterin-binding protein